MNFGSVIDVVPGAPAVVENQPILARRPGVDRSVYGRRFKERIEALYDSARTTSQNERYWENADFLSPNASNSYEVRRTLRSRSRYEIGNNSYAAGMIQTLANDTIGQGPMLQFASRNKELESAWLNWSRAINLPAILRTVCRQKRGQDGETFIAFTNNTNLTTPSQLDLRVYEADQITTPGMTREDEDRHVDGIVFDSNGDPSVYHVLKSHPGAMSGSQQEVEQVSADQMIHWFRVDRPGQKRGIPEITPALSLFANLRRHTMATIAAAETAADFAGVLHTDLPAGEEMVSLDEDDWFKTVPVEYRAFMTLPDGWKMSQMKAEQPSTGFVEFQRAVVTEMARCWLMPRNIAMGDSSDYTFASGQLDHLTYWTSIIIERSDLELVVVERIFQAWLAEHAAVQSGISARDLDLSLPEYEHSWIWPAREPRDMLNDAKAREVLFHLGYETDEEYWMSRGLDPEKQRQRLLRQQSFREENDLPQAGVRNVQLAPEESNGSQAEEDAAQADSQGTQTPFE